MTKLSYGLNEGKSQSSRPHAVELLTNEGAYGDCHRVLDEIVLEAGIPTDVPEAKFLLFCRLSVVHECEEAKRWLHRQYSGGSDYWQDKDEYDDQRARDLGKAATLIGEFRKIEKRQPYWIRQGLARALTHKLPVGFGFDAVFPDANHEEGGVHVSVSAQERELLEREFLARAAFERSDTLLTEFEEYLSRFAERKPYPWNWLGNLYLDPPLSRKAKAAIRRNEDESLGVAALGLSTALSAFFRQVSAKKVPRMRIAGTSYPAFGKPNWNLVSMYLNAAFGCSEPFTAEDTRKRWHTISKAHQMRLHNWSEAAVREPQIS